MFGTTETVPGGATDGITNAGEHMRQITGGVMSAAKDASKGKF